MSLYDEMVCTFPQEPHPARIFAECFSFLDSPGSRKIIADELGKFLKEREVYLNEFNKLLEEDAAALSLLMWEIERAFCTVLDELHSKGIALNGWQVSRLSKYDMPDEIKAKINLLKRETHKVIPEAERLTTQDAAALFYGLHKSKFIEGEKAEFIAHFAKGLPEEEKYGLLITWKGTKAQLAYFIHLYSLFVSTKPGTTINREKAFCRIFGIDDKTRKNTIRPCLSELHKGYYYKSAGMKYRECRGGKKIEDIFNTLPSLTANAETGQEPPRKGAKPCLNVHAK